MNKFAEWVEVNDKKQYRIAEKIGVAPSTINDIIKRGQMPTLKIAYEIEVYTNGDITLYDWIDQGEQNKKLNKSKSQTETNRSKQ